MSTVFFVLLAITLAACGPTEPLPPERADTKCVRVDPAFVAPIMWRCDFPDARCYVSHQAMQCQFWGPR